MRKILRRMRSNKLAVAATAAVLVLAVSTSTFAAQSEGGGSQSSAGPATPKVADTSQLAANITTGGGTYDPTILTKFISGRGFVANQGTGADLDLVEYSGLTCVSRNASSAGALTTLFAPVELPNGARIKQLTFYGQDSDVVDILIQLHRNQITIPTVGVPTRADLAVADFTSAGVSGVGAASSADNLGEVTGSFSVPAVSIVHRFHNIEVTLQNSAPTQILCGVEVQYQVPASAADPGAVFHPISPVRAFDSRIVAYPQSGLLTSNASRVIDISAGHDLTTGAVTAVDVVPAGATAITYNITSADSTGPNFLAVTPGDATSFSTSAINFNGTTNIANAATVAIAANRTIRLWVGGTPGATQVIIDVTGYYAPPVPIPNMGN